MCRVMLVYANLDYIKMLGTPHLIWAQIPDMQG